MGMTGNNYGISNDNAASNEQEAFRAVLRFLLTLTGYCCSILVDYAPLNGFHTQLSVERALNGIARATFTRENSILLALGFEF